jgi:hypothetical protein
MVLYSVVELSWMWMKAVEALRIGLSVWVGQLAGWRSE